MLKKILLKGKNRIKDLLDKYRPANKRDSIVLIFIVIICFLFCIAPLFTNHYYRQNVYFTFSGAYRLFLGHLPYVDFGMPMGIGFWLLPALIFKVFGPTVFHLLISQFLLNILFLVVIYQILKLFEVSSEVILLAILFLCIAYIPLNYWPWYNNSAIVFQIFGSFFLLRTLIINQSINLSVLTNLILAGFFSFLSLITKQDAGAMNIAICIALLAFHAILYWRLSYYLIYTVSTFVFIWLYFYLFKDFSITYWFNYGQAPHFSRLNAFDFLKDIFLGSKWIKLYISVILIINIKRLFTNAKSFIDPENFKSTLYLLFTIGILLEAMVYQVTSYNPPKSNWYFHAFGIAYIGKYLIQHLKRPVIPMIAVWAGVLGFIFSDNFWDPTKAILKKISPKFMAPPPGNVVSKDNYYANKGSKREKPIKFASTDKFKSLKKIKLPTDLIEGIENLKEYPIVINNGKDLKVLNMSELTFLPYELGFTPQHGPAVPLCYHVGVCMFESEIDFFNENVDKQFYDLIIFETIPYWDNYFPYPVREHIVQHYELIDRFPGPKGFPDTYVEIYVKKS